MAGVTGEKDVIAALTEWQIKYPRATSAAVYAEGLRIYTRSQEQVPVDTGRLRASGILFPTKTRGLKFSVVIAYGTDYGLDVHERTEIGHVVGKAKFLEDPWREAQGGILQRILMDAKKYSKGGRVPQPRKIGGGDGTEGSDSK